MSTRYNPFTGTLDYTGGSDSWLDAVNTEGDLPVSEASGVGRTAKDTDSLYLYDTTSSKWIKQRPSIGTYSGTSTANGLTIDSVTVGNVTSLEVTLHSADGTNPGAVSTGTQSFAGDKTFLNNVTINNTLTTNSTILADAGIDVTATGGTDTLSIGANNADVINIGRSGATVNIIGTTNYNNVTNYQVSDKNITINKGGAVSSGSASGLEIEENSVITGYNQTSADRNSWELKAPNTAGIATITPGVSGITLDQSSHDAVTVTDTDSIDLTLSTQNISAALRLSANTADAGFVLADSTIQSTGSVGLRVQVQYASASVAGVVSTASQTLAGSKTFTGTILADSGVDVTATGGTDTLSLGATSADQVYIGRAASTSRIVSATFESVAKSIVLNKTGGAASGAATGLEVEEGGVTTGYDRVSADRNSWELKAPNTAGVATITPGAGGITLNQSSHDPVTVSDTNSIDLTLSTQNVSADLRLSSNAADSGFVIVTNNIESTSSVGLRSQVQTTALIAALDSTYVNTAGDTMTGTLNMGTQNEIRFQDTTGGEYVGLRAPGTVTASYTLNLPTTTPTADQVLSAGSGTPTDLTWAARANTSLNNLTTTSINLSLTPSTDNTIDLGTSASTWRNLYIKTGLVLQETGAGTDSTTLRAAASITTPYTLTLPPAVATVAGSAIVSDASGNLSYTTIAASSAGDIAETSFTAADNQAVAANVTGLAFANGVTRSFICQLSIVRDTTYAIYELAGIQKGASWEMSQMLTGDDTGLTFTITTAGQVQYVSTSTGNTALLKFRATTTTV